MKKTNHPGSLAIKEHLLSGQPITQLEAMLIFGVTWLTKLTSQLRKEGYSFDRGSISYLKLKKRINTHVSFTPPQNLPVKEILFTEWWIKK